MKCLPSTDHVLRPVRLDDSESVRTLLRAMYADLREPPPPEDWIELVLTQALAGEREIWLAEVDGQLSGFVNFKLMPYRPSSESRFCFIFELFVLPEGRMRGVGRSLARHAIDTAVRSGADAMELTVLPSNVGAQNFWKSVGFDLQLYKFRLGLPLAPDATSAG